MSHVVRVTASPEGGGGALVASPPNAVAGGTLSVAWKDVASPTAWFAVGRTDVPDDQYLTSVRWPTNGLLEGNRVVLLPPALPAGLYEVRLFSGDGTRQTKSNAFTVERVTPPPPPPVPTPIGTYQVSHYYNASGCSASAPNPFNCSYLSGPVVVDPSRTPPGDYRVDIVGLLDPNFNPGGFRIWDGDASGGTQYGAGTTFHHSSGHINLYAWDWYPWDNPQNSGWSVAVYRMASSTPTSTVVTSSVNPSVVGQSVTFTATVSGGAGGTGSRTWQVSNPGFPSGTSANSIWARNRTDAFLWGTRTMPTTSVPESYLYHWDGNSWTQVFYLAGYSGTSVFGTGSGDVWVSAYAGSTGSVVYRSVNNGGTWTKQSLPNQIGNAYVWSLTGTSNNIQASAGSNTIIRFDGTNWNALNAGGTVNGDAPGAMTLLSPTEGYYSTCWGWGAWNGSSWTFHADGFDFCDVSSIWGKRDTAGNLGLYTAGNNNFSNGVRV